LLPIIAINNSYNLHLLYCSGDYSFFFATGRAADSYLINLPPGIMKSMPGKKICELLSLGTCAERTGQQLQLNSNDAII
jgi:hypothetical protein